MPEVPYLLSHGLMESPIITSFCFGKAGLSSFDKTIAVPSASKLFKNIYNSVSRWQAQRWFQLIVVFSRKLHILNPVGNVHHVLRWLGLSVVVLQGFTIRNTRVHHMSERANENTVEHHWTFCRRAHKVNDWLSAGERVTGRRCCWWFCCPC